MHLSTKIRYNFDVSGAELGNIIRALNKCKAYGLANKIKEQRFKIANALKEQTEEALNMQVYIEAIGASESENIEPEVK